MNFVAFVILLWLRQGGNESVIEKNVAILPCRNRTATACSRAPWQETERPLLGHQHVEHVRG
jgi:hypothetical protein